MTVRSSYVIECLSYSSSKIVWLGDIKVAILFPPSEQGGPYELYPHPGTFPELTSDGLPEPLQPGFMPFATLDDVYAFLGIPAERALAA